MRHLTAQSTDRRTVGNQVAADRVHPKLGSSGKLRYGRQGTFGKVSAFEPFGDRQLRLFGSRPSANNR